MVHQQQWNGGDMTTTTTITCILTLTLTLTHNLCGKEIILLHTNHLPTSS